MVYVNKRYTGAMQTGSLACPFTTIAQGLATAQGLTAVVRTVSSVAGSTPALHLYREAISLSIGPGIILLGAGGLGTASVVASGPCAAGTCAVTLGGSSVIDGLTVTSPKGDGIVTPPGNQAGIIRNALVTDCIGNGIVAQDLVDIGPSATVKLNGGNGVESLPAAGGTIHVIGLANAFDNNTGNGIDINGTALLNFEGGSASSNGQGIRLAGTGSSALSPHTITSLKAVGNTGPGGLVAYSGQSLKLRSSTLVSNSGVGLLYNYGPAGAGSLDLGSPASLGANVFGGATLKNVKAGLQLCSNVSALAAVIAEADSWSACAPIQTKVSCSLVGPSLYTDVAYDTTLLPVSAVGCTVGP